MMRILFIFIIVISVAFIFLEGRLRVTNSEKPVFLRTDEIADVHQTKIKINIHSMFQPNSFQLESFKKDYSNLWAHLNHLFETNDVQAGKEYYTEDWFRQITRHYGGTIKTTVTRNDLQHELHIQNWSSDGLICTVTDSNLVFRYRYPDQSFKSTRANIALVLLFQGDHWRLDALRIINESDAEK